MVPRYVLLQLLQIVASALWQCALVLDQRPWSHLPHQYAPYPLVPGMHLCVVVLEFNVLLILVYLLVSMAGNQATIIVYISI